MRRFKQNQLIEYIKECSETLNKKPTIKEVTIYINSTIKPEDYSNHNTYMEMLVSDSLLRYYVNDYKLKPLFYKKDDKEIDYDLFEALKVKPIDPSIFGDLFDFNI